MEAIKNIKLDSKDKRILEIMDKNARMSIAKISKKTGIQRDSIMYRLKRMESSGVIAFYHARVNPVQIGYPVYSFVNITLYNLNKEEEQKFVGYLNATKNVTYIAKTTGKWDFTLSIAAKNLKHFDEIITQIRYKFSKIIKEYEVASIVEEYKFDSVYELI